MLITLIALRSLWCVLRERQQRRLARISLRQLTEIGLTDAAHEREVGTTFWRAVRIRYKRDASFSEARRARSRKAMSRLSRISERKQARHAALKMDMRKYASRPN